MKWFPQSVKFMWTQQHFYDHPMSTWVKGFWHLQCQSAVSADLKSSRRLNHPSTGTFSPLENISTGGKSYLNTNRANKWWDYNKPSVIMHIRLLHRCRGFKLALSLWFWPWVSPAEPRVVRSRSHFPQLVQAIDSTQRRRPLLIPPVGPFLTSLAISLHHALNADVFGGC